ncbi:hybrid sensor histidine kinase/response regulator [Blautia glucerasea]|uniref:hybrid sensor histidine kinase/response regulator n=1 Tax=Blautia TaxID=572511 RepID=UPI001D0761BD|nr:ATP-binding protein [Blautia glucerasea]MCB6545543.1 response regulator [Blautia glucerasea]
MKGLDTMFSHKEEYALNKLLPEYVSLYHIDLNSGKYEILRIASNTNARLIAEQVQSIPAFDEYAQQYAEAFILKEDREEFLDWHLCKNMKKRLLENEKITYHYHSVSKEGKDSYYEAYAVKENVDKSKFYIFLGYRNIDSILYKEKAIQEKLQRALDETRLSNEIISSIAKTYQYISRIDIEADWFEEISNRDRIHMKFLKGGCVSQGNKKICKDVVAEEYQEAFLKFTDLSTLPERMKKEETIAMEYRMKDGNWHKLRFIEKKRDKNGKLTHVLCAIRSVSDAKKKEQMLISQVAEAKKDAALKARFLSNMSHDIRTPLNGIMGMLDQANHYPDNLEMQQKFRDKMMESSKYLLSLVNNILEMNKLEAEEYTDKEISFNLADVLKQANTERQILAEKKNVSYIVDWENSDLTYVNLSGNPVYLERLLAAVSDNAVKFTNPGGCVKVWCKQKKADNEHVLCEFGCADNGIGMSEEFIGHAFEMFSQENQTSRTQYEGSGLGLSIAKKIVGYLGGKIELESRKGVGTTVIMTVPFRIGITEPFKKRTVHEGISLEGKRALVAEDNELNMEIVKFMLEDHGIIVDCAEDGLEAVKKFEENEPGYYDVIYMDIMMPNMNGWDATRKIRSMQRPDAGTIPIIAMSANAFAEDIINSRISGMNRHIAKPLDAESVLNVFKECINISENKEKNK